MTSSLRDVSINDFRMPPRAGSILSGKRDKERTEQVLRLHAQGFAPEKITELVLCRSTASAARELDISTQELDRLTWNDGSGFERSPSERIGERFAANLRWVHHVIAEHAGEIQQTDSRPAQSNRKSNCIARAQQ